MGELVKIAEDKSVPVAVRLAAIRDALDRAGLGSRQGLDVAVELGQQSKADRWADVVESVLIPMDAYDPLSDLPRELTADPNVIDAEVVEDELPPKLPHQKAGRAVELQRRPAPQTLSRTTPALGSPSPAANRT